jgi:hypothetical protein
LSGREAVRFSTFWKMKRLFFTAPNAKKQRQMEVIEMTKCGLSVTRHVQSVSASSVTGS